MKHLWKRMLSALLLLALVLSLLPGLPMKAEAGGIIPGQLATVDAGQEMTMEVQGGYSSTDTTILVFQSVGNTIATIVGYDRSGEIIMDVAICDDDYMSNPDYYYRGYRFEIKVLYGQIQIIFNTVGSEDPICTYYEFGDKLDWLVKPTIHEVYMKVGDTATLNVSQVTEGFSARANDYEDNYSDVARVSEDGIITAHSPGTTTVYMQVLFWQTSSQYFYFWVPCAVHVIEDYTLDAYWNGYYAEPGEKYFNIVAYRPDGMRDVGFTITVGDQSYSTGTRTNALVPIPADYAGTVTVSKEGYHPYELKAEDLEVSNVITMTPSTETGPVIRAVWMRPAGEANRNAKYQAVQVHEGTDTVFEISCDILWNGYNASAIYLQQGDMTLHLSEEGEQVALGKYLTADGGQVYLYVLTFDGSVISVPLLVNVAAPVTIMEMNFGEGVSTNVDESVTGLGGTTVGFDMFSTVPVEFELGADGSVRGLIGLKFSGPASADHDLYEIQGEIRQIVKEMESAEESGDKKLTGSLKQKLDKLLTDEKAYLEDRKVGFGFSSDVSFMGYFDGVMTDDGLDITEVGMIAILNVSAVGGGNFYIRGVPAQWKLSFADELELLVCGLAEGSNGKLNFRVPEFTNKISVTGAVRAHALDVVGVSIALQGNFTFEYPREADSFADGTWSVDANFKVIGDLAGTDFNVLDLDSIDGLKIWPNTDLAANAGGNRLMPASADTRIGTPGNISDAVEKAIENTQAFRSEICTDTLPQLARLENMDVMVWTEELDSRAETGDRPCLYYAVRSHETDTWSDPVPVYDDGYADHAPRLMVAGDTLYVAWQKNFGSVAGLTETADILAGRDIYVARFDAAGGTFQTAEMVHEPDDCLDLLPQVQIWNGSLAVAWVRVNGDFTDPEVTGSILRSTYSEDDGWMTRRVAEVSGIPDGLAFGEDGTLYYTLNGRLYSLADGAPTAMTPEEAYARAPKLCGGTLYWLEDDCVTDGTVRIPASGTTDDFSLHISPNGSRKVLTFYAADENGRGLFATYGQDDRWGQPISVLPDDDNAQYRGSTGYVDNSGKLCVATNRLRTHSSGNQISYLRLITKNPRQDLALTELDYLGTSMTQEGYLLANAYVANEGTLPVTTVQLQVMEGETLLLSTAANLELLPGESGSAEIVIPMEMAAREGVAVTVQPAGGTDADLTDNTADLVLNPGDISAEYMTLDTLPDGTVQVAAMLINRGMTDLTGIRVVFTRGTSDGEVLGTLDAGDAAVGGMIPVNTTLSGLSEGELIYMTASLDGEENYISNNTAFAQVCPVARETSTVLSGEELEKQQLELDTYYSFAAARDEETQTTSNFSGIFTPEETGFYLIIAEGTRRRGHPDLYASATAKGASRRGTECVRSEVSEMPDGVWSEQAIYSIYMEAGLPYSVRVYADAGSLVTLQLEKAPEVTDVQISDHTMYLGEHLVWDLCNIYRLGLVSFQPELSRDLMNFRSSDEDVVTVDEYGDITTHGVGTAVITATGLVYGLEESFTITVLEPEYDEPLTVGENAIRLEWEQSQSARVLTAPETGYYHFTWEEGNGVDMLNTDGVQRYLEPFTVLLRAGEAHTFFFDGEMDLTIRKVEPRGETHAGDDPSCDGTDCENVMLYRYIPQEDHLLHIWFRGSSSILRIFDDGYNLLHSAHADGGYWFSSGKLTAEVQKGKTYYIALEHTEECEMSLSRVTMELDYYSPVFVGDTIELSPDFTDGGNEEDYTFIWSSSDTSVARVDQEGVVQFLKEGYVTIKVATADGLLRAEKTFYAIGTDEIYLDREFHTTLNNRGINGARLVFRPESSGDYLYRISYKASADIYWSYEYVLTDPDENYLDIIHNENVHGKGNYTSLHLEAGQTCVLTLYFEADHTEPLDFDMTFLVNRLECGTKGHTYGPGYGWEPDCEYPGMTAGEHCLYCGDVRVPQEEIPALGHNYVDGVCTRCGGEDPDYVKPEDPDQPEKPEDPSDPVEEDEVIRLAGSHRWETALKVADEMKANLGIEKFGAIIIASGNDFADALAGSYLSTVKNAPILLGWGKGGKFEYLDTDNIEYIKANLAEGGTVYILGGKNAVPELYENELKGYNVKRLGGANRFETNLLILAEAGVADGSEILVCTSTNFADSLSASATAKPILLVFNEYGKLYGKQPEFLSNLKNCTFTVIGGESAVSAKLADEVAKYGKVERLAGANRFETSVMVAQKYFKDVDTAVLAYAWNYPDGLCGGSLAYSLKAPLILTMTKYEAKAVEYAKAAGIETGLVLGGDTLISDEAVRSIFAMDAADEIIEK